MGNLKNFQGIEPLIFVKWQLGEVEMIKGLWKQKQKNATKGVECQVKKNCNFVRQNGWARSSELAFL